MPGAGRAAASARGPAPPSANDDDVSAIEITNVELGSRYRDVVTDFTGVATARIEYLNGCVQAQLEASVGGEPRTQWVDYDRLELVDRDAVARFPRGTGGPGPATAPGFPTP